ncbi:hypothetical protein N7448_011304 [Penicillium atrosanguineum]|nr:hypothetical protein N7448_011304 [Penicillium atrosanguineum]
MPPGAAERAATPELTEQSAEPTAPQPLRTSNRPIRAPVSYSREQERDAASRLDRRQRKNLPEPSLREDVTTEDVTPRPDHTDPTLRAILEAFGRIENSNKYLHQEIEARHVETSRFQSQITELRNELRRRDEGYQDEIKGYKDALADMQRKMEEFKQTAVTTGLTTCACNGHYEEIRAELQSLRSASSVVSPNTQTVRSSLGLPAVVLDLRLANEETKALVDDPTQTREKVRAALKEETTTSKVEIIGVKPTSRTTVKVFVDTEESVAHLRRATHWLNFLPGATLQGEQWFPVKLNDVKRESVYGTSGAQREDFTQAFQEENDVEQVRKIVWLSGTKRYGSIAIYLSRPGDAETLLNRRIAHVRGEAVFSDRFYERPRTLRCRKYQQYNHKEDRCPNPKHAASALAIIAPSSAHPMLSSVLPVTRHPLPGGLRPHRCMIWVNNTTFPHRQIDVASADIAAVLLFTPSPILTVSVYIPPGRGREGTSTLTQGLDAIRDARHRIRCEYGDNIDTLIVGDFNRHDQLWGGNQVATQNRQGEAEPIVLMADWGLTSLLPRGISTREEGPFRSTIDLVLASTDLSRRVTRCRIHPVEHGSDHRAIETTFHCEARSTLPSTTRFSFREAPWADINRELRDLETEIMDITDHSELDATPGRLTSRICSAIRQLVPVARPSPHGKRWWTPELTALRDTYTWTRNRSTQARRYGVDPAALEDTALCLRRRYHRAIRDAKRRHWREFLDNTDNIWKAVRYLQPGDQSMGIVPTLRSGERTINDDQGKAHALLETFFPPLPIIQGGPRRDGSLPDALPMETITDHEIEMTLMRMAPWKAPGPDALPVVVWQQIWPTVKHWVIEIFQASLRLSYFPSAWKAAKIVVIPKGGRDPSLPKSYRPISLLATLGKVLEAVVANRISALVEKHQLLPPNHFGARRRRSCEQALNILIEKIYDAWREGKVLSLVSFDVTGAYNGVDRTVLLRRLRERRIPDVLVRWVDSFCSSRRASIVVNMYQSEEMAIEHAGLPQGSPLSPILFLFLNANLMDVPITRRKGAIAFVDDYTRWTVGPSAEANTSVLQRKVVPRALEWAAQSGAAFEAEKTSFIHFTRNQRHRQLPAAPLLVKGATVTPAPELKILGVILDQDLRFKSHIGMAANKGMKAVLALRRLRGLPPLVARQLFASTVSSKIDYAASVWCPIRQDASVAAGIVRLFEAIQRVASQAIVGVFRTTALAIAEAEAAIEPTVVRLRARILKHWIVCHTLPQDHPFWSCRAAAAMQDGKYPSPFKILAKYGPHCLSETEIIRPFPLDPQQRSLGELIATVGSDMQELHEAGHARLWLFTSVSVRNGLVGTGLVVRVNQVDIVSSNRTVGTEDALNAHFAQLGVVSEAVAYVETMLPRIQMSPWKVQVTNVITEAVNELVEMGAKVSLKPPTDEDSEITTRAHALARNATEVNSEIHAPPWARVQLRASALRWARANVKQHRKDHFQLWTTGQFTRQLDSALPGPHTKTLLNGYLHRIGKTDSDWCDCGVERETVSHFLLRCTRWKEQRRALIDATGPSFGSLSQMLGGKAESLGDVSASNGKAWKVDVKIVRAVIAFAMETGRLAPEG